MKHDVKESAKRVRRILKSTYPEIKFSVRSERFAGGSAVRIRWTNGPTERQISELTARFKGYENGFYNDYISTSRDVTPEAMQAAAQAAAEYYEIPVPQVMVSSYGSPYLTDMTPVNGFNSLDRKEPVCDKIHRAAWSTDIYQVDDMVQAYAKAYPI